ncbi:hypothetical protein [Micromonospora sp. CNB394]|uniref:hypothetical protein n=1 Tax=Micromonospora sp. CNB394 TaxID=1169151 RepID=UPI0004781C43|nr:hypothetical protein [Micromonospora sp. CNB394]
MDRPRESTLSRTLLFVHGTGTRAERYAETLTAIQAKIAERKIDADLRGCYWGDAVGARLNLGGTSIPRYAETGGSVPDEMLALWSVLYTDPWYQLRLLRRHTTGGIGNLGEESPADFLREQINEFHPSAEMRDQLGAAGLSGEFDEALAALRAAPEFEQAIRTAPADPVEHRAAIARALIAYASVATTEAGRPQIDGGVRDALVTRLGDELDAYVMSVKSTLLAPVLHLATRKITSDRGAITDGTGPLAGDVLRFLARGDAARTFLRAAIDDIGGDVYLLAHSLGGVMSVDLLVREAPPNVRGLITIGSQAPFLYEIGALPALAQPEPLTKDFPAWLNIYDLKDPLSYVGRDVFGTTVTDVQVDNGQPFPQSHSAYWSNSEVWAAVAAFLK